MRTELANAVRTEFTHAMARNLPQFLPVAIKSRYAWPGSRIFRWAAAPSLHFFVELFFDAKGDDAFGVEVGWSALGRYPELPVRPGFGAAFDKPEHWVRLSALYSPVGGMWSLETAEGTPGARGESIGRSPQVVAGLPSIPFDQALARVGPCVGDAVDKLILHALPYFHEVLKMKSTSR